MEEQRFIYRRTYKDYRVNTPILIRQIKENVKAGKSMLHYANKYMDAAITLAMYDMGDRTYAMVENGREYYAGQAQLWLSKAVNCILYFQSSAKLKGNRVFDGMVRRDNYCDCIDLVSSVYQALMDFFHYDLTEENIQAMPVQLLEVA